jgi:hypothetical protein
MTWVLVTTSKRPLALSRPVRLPVGLLAWPWPLPSTPSFPSPSPGPSFDLLGPELANVLLDVSYLHLPDAF